jgi:hypothetical protein
MKLFELAECAFVLGLVACGGSSSSGSSNPDGGGGGGAVGGSGGSGPAAQAAAYVHIMAAEAAETPAGKSCSVETHNATIGNPPSTTTKGLPVVDGEGGVVTCSVTGSGTFAFSASATYGSTSFAIMEGSITAGGSGTAIIQVCDATTTFCLQSPAQPDPEGFGGRCNVFVDQDSLEVSAGRIWARFECPALANDSTPNVWCAADSGVFVLENCDDG